MAELTAEMVADMTLPRDLELSPDGRQVAYTLAPSGKREEHPTVALWVAPIDGPRAPRRFTAGTANDHSPRWSPDGANITFLSDRAKRGTDALYLIAADGGEARALTSSPDKNKKAVEDFAWSPGGSQIAFTSADEPTEEDERREKERDDAGVYGERWPYARLRLFSLATEQVTTLVDGDRHVAAFTWSPEGTELAYVTQQIPGVSGMERELTIERIAVAGGEPHVVCRFPCWIQSLAWSNDGETLLFVAPVNRTSQSSYAVYAVPAQGGEPRRVALGEESCAGGLRQPRGSARAVVSVGAGLETRLCLLDTTMGTLETIYPASEEDRASDVAAWDVRPLADGGVVMAVARSTGAEPWEVWAGRAETAGQKVTLRAISSHQDALTGIVWSRQEAFTWTAPDGWELDGLLVRPPGDAGEGALPAVVLVHGGPYGRWNPGFNLGWYNWAQWLALAGYAILMPNPRGGYGHGEAFAAAARGDVGGADYHDVMAMVDAAVERGLADPARLGIGGWSQGGFMSAWAVTQTHRFKAAVMGAGVSDWSTMVMTSDLPGFEGEISGGAPWDGPEQRRPVELSPIYHARAASTPVLILHGEKDERVPLNQAIGFHRALRAHDVPVELVVYPREPHGIGERNHQIDVLKRVRSWYDRWLKV